MTLGMLHQKQTATRAEKAKARAKAHKELMASKNTKEKEWQTTVGGKAPHKKYTMKVARKTGAWLVLRSNQYVIGPY